MSDREEASGAASRSNPSRLERRLTSLVIRTITHPTTRRLQRRLSEARRRRAGAAHRVEYFHQVADPYSHLAAQVLGRLTEAYDIELVTHVVGSPSEKNAPEPELLAAYARKDAADIAGHHRVDFVAGAKAPAPAHVELAERCVTAAPPDAFSARAVELGEALWRGDAALLGEIAEKRGTLDAATAASRIAEGNARRAKLGHYAGAMFHYAGEWYWGIDRLHHLERRLAELGATRPGASTPVAPRPAFDFGIFGAAPPDLTLEYFPSLRSPYTAINFDRTVELARRTGVRLVLRPVLPMVMRGVPATFAKGRYIFLDARREAEVDGVAFGRIVDPIGPPVERALSLFPWARDRGKDVALFSSFLRGAFAEGVDTSVDSGLRRVVETAGLPWSEATEVVDNDDWRAEIEGNRVTMYDELGLWGVPSFRIRRPGGAADFATWGQDRLWLVARELGRRPEGDR